MFIGCQSFLCVIFLDVLCRFWGKILCLNSLYVSICLKEFPPFPNIKYVYVVHALLACHCKSKTDLCLYIYINNCYNIFTVLNSPFSTRRICSRDAKRKQEFSNVIGWRKSSLLRQPITLPDSCFRFASREQIRNSILVENGLKWARVLKFYKQVLHVKSVY